MTVYVTRLLDYYYLIYSIYTINSIGNTVLYAIHLKLANYYLIIHNLNILN